MAREAMFLLIIILPHAVAVGERTCLEISRLKGTNLNKNAELVGFPGESASDTNALFVGGKMPRRNQCLGKRGDRLQVETIVSDLKKYEVMGLKKEATAGDSNACLKFCQEQERCSVWQFMKDTKEEDKKDQGGCWTDTSVRIHVPFVAGSHHRLDSETDWASVVDGGVIMHYYNAAYVLPAGAAVSSGTMSGGSSDDASPASSAGDGLSGPDGSSASANSQDSGVSSGQSSPASSGVDASSLTSQKSSIDSTPSSSGVDASSGSDLGSDLSGGSSAPGSSFPFWLLLLFLVFLFCLVGGLSFCGTRKRKKRGIKMQSPVVAPSVMPTMTTPLPTYQAPPPQFAQPAVQYVPAVATAAPASGQYVNAPVVAPTMPIAQYSQAPVMPQYQVPQPGQYQVLQTQQVATPTGYPAGYPAGYPSTQPYSTSLAGIGPAQPGLGTNF